MPSGQTCAPLVQQLRKLSDELDTPFYAPGHKRGRGVARILTDLLGKKVFSADLPELPQLDNLFAPDSVILEAQTLASQVFGALKTWFLVNGSTGGILAAIMAACEPDAKIIVPRNIHQSVISGLILSGAIPIFISPRYDGEIDITYGITPVALSETLAKHPDTRAVLVVYPTYQGLCCDLETIAAITHSYNIPLLVDEAHGAHFAFHPDLPPSALSCGADLTVQSTHKTLGSMTQTAMLHLNSDRISPHRISQALALVQSTSPNYPLLASLDAARHQMANEGFQLLSRTINVSRKARAEIALIKDLSVLSPHYRADITRLTVIVKDRGLTGYEVDEILQEKFRVTAELPSPYHITFIISIGNTEKDVDRLITALKQLPARPNFALFPQPPRSPNLWVSPRTAFFSPTTTVDIEASIDKISAELICPYPPGIPLLIPGEIITAEAIDYLKQIQELGGVITGCSDGKLRKIKIIAN
ncbi:MAG: Arginine decarboxylase [Chroococcopsis gigantea SAG 12.99]|jgi:arginine decarboxylase|nr:aminotransferase class I/II-fold pyridoxal phosphate-dependent enzyme [Chlorogloea purpurea SAG 13.99]MDV3000681.1 Arginine decarboxylase [Chroococcopsis gigantea SAG 12.99]